MQVTVARDRLRTALLSLQRSAGQEISNNKALVTAILLSSHETVQDAAYVFLDLLRRGGSLTHPMFSDERVQNEAIRYILGEIGKQNPPFFRYPSSNVPQTDVVRHAKKAIEARRAELLLLTRVREIRALAPMENLSPLHYVALNSNSFDDSIIKYAGKVGCAALIQYFVDTGEFVDVKVLDRSNKSNKLRGSTPLHLAAGEGNERCIRILLENGARIDLRDGDNRTPLHLAALHGYQSCVNCLSKLGANTDLLDDNNKTAKQLLTPFLKQAQKIERDAQNEGISPLIYIAKSQQFLKYMVYFIKEKKQDVNAVGPNGKAALHYGVRWGATTCLNLLVKYGARIEMKDKKGRTPYYYALAAHRNASVIRLCELGANGEEAHAEYNALISRRMERVKPLSFSSIEEQLPSAQGKEKKRKKDLSFGQDSKDREAREREKKSRKDHQDSVASTSTRIDKEAQSDDNQQEISNSSSAEEEDLD